MSLSRRDFLRQSAIAVGALATSRLPSFAAEGKPKLKSGADQVVLGNTGIKTSLLGMGTGTFSGNNQRRLGQEGFTKLVRHAYDKGITYIDTADGYSTHPFVRKAIEGLPREKLFIQTKLRSGTAEQAKADIDRFRKELGTDYIDSLLMHCMMRGSWPTDRQAVMDVMADAKAKGTVKAVGVSCHGIDPLRAAVKCKWVDIALARINPFGINMDGKPEDVVPHLKSMYEDGKGIIGMKIMGEGKIKTEDEKTKSVRYVLGLGCVHAFVIGFESAQQIDQVMEYIETAVKV